MAPASEPFTLIVNPSAGAGRAGARAHAIEAALSRAGAAYALERTERAGDATRLVREALARGTDGVAVVGGDGTTNEAVNGFFDARGEPVARGRWLAPLPCGTGGDLRRTLGVEESVEAMVAHMLAARPRPVDVGRIRFRSRAGGEETRMFLNVASFGLGGQVDELVNRGPKWLGGRAAFLLGTARAVALGARWRVRVQVDDLDLGTREVALVAVANGRFFGGGMQVAPGARIDDGLFDVVSIDAGGLADLARLVPHLYGRDLLTQRGVTHRHARRLVAEPAAPDAEVLLDVDGEAPGRLPAAFELLPGALLLRG